MKIEIVGDNKKVKNNPKIEQGKFYKVLDKFYKVLDDKAGGATTIFTLVDATTGLVIFFEDDGNQVTRTDLTLVNARYEFEEFKGSFTVTA